MKLKIILMIFISVFIPFVTLAQSEGICLQEGYTILTINGIFTDLDGAIYNKDKLTRKLDKTFNSQPLTVDFLYNETHLAGLGDAIDAVQQGLFDQKSDYDLVEMLDDASEKVKTQKLLLVAHSQGNFYSNNFYDKVAGMEGGVPKESIGMYGVASPANRVAGGGKYLTSDTDGVIAATVGRFIKILKPNIHIPLTKDDGNGHSFSDVYLKYQGDRIVSDIKSSLSKLKENDAREGSICISPPELSLSHKIKKIVFVVADPTASVVKGGVVGAYALGVEVRNFAGNIGSSIGGVLRNTSLALDKVFKNLSANVIGSVGDPSVVTTLPPQVSESEEELEEEPAEAKLPQKTENQDFVTPKTTSSTASSGEEIISENTDSIAEESIPQPSIPKKITTRRSGVSVNSVSEDETNTEASESEPETEADTPKEEEPVVEEVIPKEKTEEDSEPVVTPVADTTPPVITIIGESFEVIKKNSAYSDQGAEAVDDVDGELVVTVTGAVDTAVVGVYTITYSATDNAGNSSTAVRTVKVATHIYIPKYSFGKNNDDDNNWQVWSFNGSRAYDWTDTYVDNYLREQFKIKVSKGAYCSLCLERGIFKHDPQNGFESSDLISLTGLEDNPQNKMDGKTYDVMIQWDDTGYTYVISHDSIVDSTGHTNVSNMNKDLWVGWDGSFNKFKTFPSGNWEGIVSDSPLGRVGGSDMVLRPYPVYLLEEE